MSRKVSSVLSMANLMLSLRTRSTFMLHMPRKRQIISNSRVKISEKVVYILLALMILMKLIVTFRLSIFVRSLMC